MIDQDIRCAIGLRLREFRVSLNLTQEEFARTLKVKRQSVSSMEHGASLPGGKTWHRLFCMGMSLDYAVGGIRTVPVSCYAPPARLDRLAVLTPDDVASGTRERLPES